MAAVKNIQSQILRQRISPVRAFAGDERVHAFARGQFQIAARAAGDNPDFLADAFATGNDSRFRAGRAFQSFRQFGAGNFCLRLEANGLAVACEKRF